MKVAIWAAAPSPHQSDFYGALRDAGVDLRVGYFGQLTQARRELGWSQPAALPRGEVMLSGDAAPLGQVTDWRDRVHVVPGYSRRWSLQLAWKLSRAGVPWVHWSETSQPSWRSVLSLPLKRAYAQLINATALGAFAVGNVAVSDFVRWGIRREKMAHLYYAVRGVSSDTRLDPVAAEFTRGKLAFVFAGVINRRKATLPLVHAFAAATRDCPEARLVIVGDGPQRAACERAVDRLQVGNRVLFRGVVPQPEVGSVLKCCQVAVLPSRHDGWGVVLNEAASAGLALVASSSVGAACHLIRPGVNGFCFERESTPSLTHALRSYCTNWELAITHGDASLRGFADFTPERNAERFIAAVNSWFAANHAWRDWPTEVVSSRKPLSHPRSGAAA